MKVSTNDQWSLDEFLAFKLTRGTCSNVTFTYARRLQQHVRSRAHTRSVASSIVRDMPCPPPMHHPDFATICLLMMSVLPAQIMTAWVHQRWVWHTTVMKSVSRVMFYEELQVRAHDPSCCTAALCLAGYSSRTCTYNPCLENGTGPLVDEHDAHFMPWLIRSWRFYLCVECLDCALRGMRRCPKPRASRLHTFIPSLHFTAALRHPPMYREGAYGEKYAGRAQKPISTTSGGATR